MLVRYHRASLAAIAAILPTTHHSPCEVWLH